MKDDKYKDCKYCESGEKHGHCITCRKLTQPFMECKCEFRDNKNKSIDEMFDNKFSGIWLDGMKDYDTDKTYDERETIDLIKTFIHTIIDKEKKELAEEILKSLPKEKESYTADCSDGFNSCLSEIKEIIQKKI